MVKEARYYRLLSETLYEKRRELHDGQRCYEEQLEAKWQYQPPPLHIIKDLEKTIAMNKEGIGYIEKAISQLEYDQKNHNIHFDDEEPERKPNAKD